MTAATPPGRSIYLKFRHNVFKRHKREVRYFGDSRSKISKVLAASLMARTIKRFPVHSSSPRKFRKCAARFLIRLGLTLNRPEGRNRPTCWFSLSCTETVSTRKLRLPDFCYVLISFHSEYKPVPWDIHCCHGNAIAEECLV